MITKNELIQELESRGYIVDIRDVTKNSVHMTGINVRNNNNQRITPCVYIDDILQDYDDASNAADKIITIISNSQYPQINTDKLLTRDYLLSNVFIAVQRKSEQELVKRNTPFEDIEEYAYISGEDINNSNWSIKLTPSHLKLANITEEELWIEAEKNTFNKTEICIENIQSVLAKICGITYEDVPNMAPSMYVVTNRSKHYGAVQVFNQELQRWAKGHGYSSLIILPSSLHETIVIPNVGNINLDELDCIIQEINATQVKPVEQLSDHSYVMDVAA